MARFTALLGIAALLGSLAACSDQNGSAGVEADGPLNVTASVHEALQTEPTFRAIVAFRSGGMPNAHMNPSAHRAAVLERRQRFLAGHPGLVPLRHYQHLPAVVLQLTRASFDELAADPDVAFIQRDDEGHAALKVAVPAIGGDIVHRDLHFTGKGVRVAVLDTGINTTHDELKSSVVSSQHCFTLNDCAPGGMAEGTSAEDDHGHGSNVAGIVTNDGISLGEGFAPDADVVAVKVLDASESGNVSDWAAGLDWVFDNLDQLKVKVVNMSLGTNALYGTQQQCDQGQPLMAQAVKQLSDAGVVLFASSGNEGSSTQMESPACNTGVIAVGATYKSDQGQRPPMGNGTYQNWFGSRFANCADQTTAFDQVTCFTSSSERLDLVAPGAVIESAYIGGSTAWSEYYGTSQASPAAAGVAALMLQCNPMLTPSQILELMKSTGVSIKDPKNNLTFPSLRADKAVEAACQNMGGAGGGGAGGMAAGGSGGSGLGGTGGAGGAGGSAGAATGGAGPTGGVAGMVGVGGSAGNTSAGTNASGNGGASTGGSSGGSAGDAGMGAAGKVRSTEPVGCGCALPGAPARSPWWPGAAGLLLLGLARTGKRARFQACKGTRQHAAVPRVASPHRPPVRR